MRPPQSAIPKPKPKVMLARRYPRAKVRELLRYRLWGKRYREPPDQPEQIPRPYHRLGLGNRASSV